MHKLIDEESEICILAFNDDTVKPFLEANYAKELEEGKIVLKEHNDEREFEFAYCKDLAHRMGTGLVLMNLDADNYIAAAKFQLQEILNYASRNIALQLFDNQDQTVDNSGVQGRIALLKEHYDAIGGYKTGASGNPKADHHERMMFEDLKTLGVKILNFPSTKKPLPNIQPKPRRTIN